MGVKSRQRKRRKIPEWVKREFHRRYAWVEECMTSVDRIKKGCYYRHKEDGAVLYVESFGMKDGRLYITAYARVYFPDGTRSEIVSSPSILQERYDLISDKDEALRQIALYAL